MKQLLRMMAVATMATIGTAAADDGPGWISLFNGKDLSGWKAAGQGAFEVVDGAIRVSGGPAHLFSEQEFKDFEFKAEVRTTKGSNSGIYFHTRFQAEGWPVQGFEAQVNVSHTDPIRTGSLYGVVNVGETDAKDDEWYETHVVVQGPHITIRIDGKTTVDWEQPADLGDKQSGGRRLGFVRAPGARPRQRRVFPQYPGEAAPVRMTRRPVSRSSAASTAGATPETQRRGRPGRAGRAPPRGRRTARRSR